MAVPRSSRLGESRPRTGEQIRSAFLAFYADRGHVVIPSASLIPEDPTVLLTIAGMLPFKPVFLGHVDRPSARATSTQKCIRTNDIENVGRTARHHTFFEMLGNFSFGDYFKKEAIQWAWELSTDVFGLDPQNLVISVFREDQEAELLWRDLIGVDIRRIIKMDEKDNFWASGPTGPCGPCSEIYYDFKPELGFNKIDLEDDSRFIEFYNLVFMQYNRDAAGKLTPLANCNIDTGMGLERMAQILQGVANNYETDLIFPLLLKAAILADIDYLKVDEKIQTSLKVIADHSRAITQLISDGVMASNLGRGYILRRLLRRVVRHGRLVGITKPFLVEMGEAAINLMQSAFPQLLERRDVILHELQQEESRFLGTLERGEKLLADVIASQPSQITGEQAFELYDTYGFPVELTEEIAQENNLKIDVKGFEKAMNEQRQRAKAASVSIDLTLQDTLDQIASDQAATSFFGYHILEQKSNVQALVVNGTSVIRAEAGDTVQVILDSTVFYGEGGGQIGDRGVLDTITDTSTCVVSVDSVSHNKSVYVHSGLIQKGSLQVGDVVRCQVDRECRRRAQANHTATHLLQAALKNVVDLNISQAGSLVDFDRLRFDFHASKAVTSAQLVQIEKVINTWISESHSLQIQDMSIDEAKKAGAVAMFGEKYGEVVRVVDVPGVSMELCGGTHVTNTAEIGLFKIVAESGIAAGVRRIEAVAGPGVLAYLNERDDIVKKLGERFKTQPGEIVERVLTLQEELKQTVKSLNTVRDELATAKALALSMHTTAVGHGQLLVKRLDGLEGGSMQIAAQALLDQLGEQTAIVLGGLPNINDQSKVTFVAAFGSGLISSGLHAGKFIGTIAKLCGGGGGGRSNLAQAGGRDADSLDEALKISQQRLEEALS